ncbi:MAG: type III polyketide synthase [Actinomycetota bacterium]|nr:MAG: type III polyketide synthase [Actinomycetota bacterium]
MVTAGVPTTAVIAGFGSACPESVTQDALWDGYFHARVPAGRAAVARQIFTGSGVRRRHAVVNPLVEDVSGWSTGQRMTRYLAAAVPLGTRAVAAALEAAGVDPGEVGQLIVVSCTGYATPGLDIALARDLRLPADAHRLVVGHMGCYAAIPALGVAMDFVRSRGQVSVVLCCELTSLHAQPPSRELDQVVAHALFSDAAAAVVVRPEPAPGAAPEPTPGGLAAGRLEIVDLVVRTEPAHADKMTWDVTDLGFRMGLSAAVPDVLADCVGPLVEQLLARSGVTRSAVESWAVHPGGPRILEVAADRLGLAAGALDSSWRVLAEHGNCSSPTVLLVLDEELSRRPPAPGSWLVALAFGPGLTLAAMLLRARPCGG